MSAQPLTRRDMLRGSVAFAALAFAQHPLSVFGYDEASADETMTTQHTRAASTPLIP